MPTFGPEPRMDPRNGRTVPHSTYTPYAGTCMTEGTVTQRRKQHMTLHEVHIFVALDWPCKSILGVPYKLLTTRKLHQILSDSMDATCTMAAR